jgi:hypothetical protein
VRVVAVFCASVKASVFGEGFRLVQIAPHDRGDDG